MSRLFDFKFGGQYRHQYIAPPNLDRKSAKIILKIDEALDFKQALIEEKRGLQFILTGSSARKLKQKGVNLLGGRALICYMPPFFAAELKEAFNLPKNLRYGMLPVVLDATNPDDVLRAYAGIYLKEEVQNEGIVRNVGDFARFLETMSFSHGMVLNTSNIARECMVARKTVDHYLSIIEDLLLGFQLDVFTRKAKRSLAKHSKFYFFDSGVFYSLRPKNLFDVETEKQGPALEGIVAQHLRAWIQAQKDSYQLHYWQTSSKTEVDFILTGADCFLAIEVKNGTNLHPEDFRSLNTFQEDYPEATCLLLYRGKHRMKERGIHCIPV